MYDLSYFCKGCRLIIMKKLICSIFSILTRPMKIISFVKGQLGIFFTKWFYQIQLSSNDLSSFVKGGVVAEWLWCRLVARSVVFVHCLMIDTGYWRIATIISKIESKVKEVAIELLQTVFHVLFNNVSLFCFVTTLYVVSTHAQHQTDRGLFMCFFQDFHYDQFHARLCVNSRKVK